MRVLIVDDEDLARARLRRPLSAHADVEVVGELGDTRRAMSALAELAPDVALLDVRMPGRDGFDVAAALDGRPCAVVFVTAWSDHAVRAFEAGAVDYLVKPVDAERLARALDRARDWLQRAAPAIDTPPPAAAEVPATPPRFAVRDGGQLVFVAIADVDAATASGNYVNLQAGPRTYTMRATLAEIEARLDPGAFVRVHRSVILGAARIAAIAPLFRGEYLITLADGTTFTSARGHRADLRRALGLP